MNARVKRIRIAVASVAIAGSAAFGTAGSASAATSEPAGHDRFSTVDLQSRDHRYWSADWDDRNGDTHLEYRWDGHRLCRLEDGRWIDVTPYRHGVVDRWYVDQVIAAQL